MASMRPDEARHFSEQDEDPAKVFALFDAAEREGGLGRTAPSSPHIPGLAPLRELASSFVAELRWRERLALVLRHLARELETSSRSHRDRRATHVHSRS